MSGVYSLHRTASGYYEIRRDGRPVLDVAFVGAGHGLPESLVARQITALVARIAGGSLSQADRAALARGDR